MPDDDDSDDDEDRDDDDNDNDGDNEGKGPERLTPGCAAWGPTVLRPSRVSCCQSICHPTYVFAFRAALREFWWSEIVGSSTVGRTCAVLVFWAGW